MLQSKPEVYCGMLVTRWETACAACDLHIADKIPEQKGPKLSEFPRTPRTPSAPARRPGDARGRP